MILITFKLLQMLSVRREVHFNISFCYKNYAGLTSGPEVILFALKHTSPLSDILALSKRRTAFWTAVKFQDNEDIEDGTFRMYKCAI